MSRGPSVWAGAMASGFGVLICVAAPEARRAPSEYRPHTGAAFYSISRRPRPCHARTVRLGWRRLARVAFRRDNAQGRRWPAELRTRPVKTKVADHTSGEFQRSGLYGYGRYEVVMQASNETGVVSSFFTYAGEDRATARRDRLRTSRPIPETGAHQLLQQRRRQPRRHHLVVRCVRRTSTLSNGRRGDHLVCRWRPGSQGRRWPQDPVNHGPRDGERMGRHRQGPEVGRRATLPPRPTTAACPMCRRQEGRQCSDTFKPPPARLTSFAAALADRDLREHRQRERKGAQVRHQQAEKSSDAPCL